MGQLRIHLSGLLIACALAAPASLQAQEQVPAVPYKQVPDLSTPPDGIDEYVVMLDNRAFCGSGGCTTDVVRLGPAGEFQILAGILRHSFGFAYTSTDGMRDLLSEGNSGKFIWRFDGKEYKPHKGHPKAATTAP